MAEKKPAAVVAAAMALDAKDKELAAAKDAVRRLEAEVAVALAALRDAQVTADAALPQCRMVRIVRYSGRESDIGRVVILKKTPSGVLVTRPVGHTGQEYRFKHAGWSGQYVQQKKATSFINDRLELRDVPAEFMPTVECTQGSKPEGSQP